MKADAIRDLVHRLVEAAYREGSFTESVAIEIERQWRFDYRGTEINVSYKPIADRAAARQQPVSEYIDGLPIDEITKRHGISRATLYRYLKK